MESNELRIGNFVEMNSRLGIIIGLLEFGAKQFRYVNGTEIFNDTNKELKPIPLNEEWLLKLNFSKLDEDTFYLPKFSDFDIVILDDILDIKFNGFYMMINFKYIHQLQNLFFALTGEELTLNK